MTVTELHNEKKHLVSVSFDSHASVQIDRDAASEAGISVGRQLSEEALQKLCIRSDFLRTKERALWYLDRSDHSEKALYQKLIHAGFVPERCAEVLAYLREYGLVDDRRYAEHLAERCAEEHRSERDTVSRMMQKGVPRELAKEMTDSMEIDEETQIKAVIEKKYRGKLSEPKSAQKLFAALVRRGFSYSAVRTALREFSAETDEE